MRIVSWNCRYGLNEIKSNAILEAYPETDIFVIQESKQADMDAFQKSWKYKNWYGDCVEESNLGIAVFSKTWKFEFTKEFNRNFRYVVPFHVSRNNKSFNLFAVWTKSDKYGGLYDYDKNVCLAVKYPEYQSLLKEKAVLIGDFNTFAKNDDEFKNIEIELAPLANCAHKEYRKTATYSHAENNFGTDDFCFASKDLSVTKFEVGVSKIRRCCTKYDG